MAKTKVYRYIDRLPEGHADHSITEGCLVLEGGAWKGLFTAGVLDALMMHGINFRTTVGISAGALFGLGYVSGQIGWAPRIDLRYRHDPEYVGSGAMRTDHGVTGFTYLYGTIMRDYPMDVKRLYEPERRLLVGATNMQTGELTYFEKGHCNLAKAVQASATVPYVSRPVVIGNVPYLDGGCAAKIPYDWAKENGERKIMVVKTRERSFRRKEGAPALAKVLYREYPAFLDSLEQVNGKFNRMTEELLEAEKSGKIFLMAPSEKVEVSRFEGNMDKLGDLYWEGYSNMEDRIPGLLRYLES